ncbi:putative polygalacturonase, partial [Folsomia candida]
VPIILARISEPTFPDVTFNILEYGAIPAPNLNDVEAPFSVVDANTNAFRNAIGLANIFGVWVCLIRGWGQLAISPITIRSNVNVHLATRESIVRFTRNTTAYPLVFTRWEGIELINYSPFVYAFEEENIALTAVGLLDGNCDCEHWWPWKGTWYAQCWETTPINQTIDRDALFQMAEDDVPVVDRVFGEGHYLRPQFIQPYRSKNVLIQGITITNSPMWIVHPVLCDNVVVRDVNITSLGPNSDGVDPESCKDVWIYNVTFNNGDDDIAIKSGRNADGRRVNVSSENIVIQDCSMEEGHGGVTLGSCISGGVKKVFAERIYLSSDMLDTAIRGGLLEGFYLRDITVGRVGRQVIEVDFFYEEGPNAGFVPVIKDFVIQNLTLLEFAPYTCYIRGYEGHPNASFVGLRLENATFNGVANDPHYVVENVDVVELENVVVNGAVWEWGK